MDKATIVGMINDSISNKFDWLKKATYKPVEKVGGENIVYRKTNFN